MKPFSFSLQSFFTKIFGGFIVIILFLILVNIITGSYLQNKMHDETIKYNEADIVKMVDQFEQLWENLIFDIKLRFYTDPDVLDLYYGKESNVTTSWNVSNNVRSLISAREYQMIDNILIVMQSESRVVHSHGMNDMDAMFTDWLVSDYDLDFWKQQFAETTQDRFLPVSDFEMNIYTPRTNKRLLPLIIRNQNYPHMYLTLLIDIQQLMDMYLDPLITDFFMLTSDTKLYKTSEDWPDFELFDLDTGHHLVGDNFYFYRQGDHSGITYVNKIESGLITAEKARLQTLIWGGALLALVLSMLISWFMSVRLYSPVQQTMKLFQDLKRTGAPQDEFGEFQVINNQIKHLINQNETISKDLKSKKSLLKSYAYSIRLKNIYTSTEQFKDVNMEDKPYYGLLLFEITFHQTFKDKLGLDEEKAVYYYCELIDQYMSQTRESTATFQIENRQIITMIFSEHDKIDVEQEIEGLLKLLDSDLEFCFFTIVIGETYDSKTIMTHAFQNVQETIGNRRLGTQNQVIYEGEQQERVEISEKDKNALKNYLDVYNFSMVQDWVQKHLSQLEKRKADLNSFIHFTNTVCDLIQNHLQKKYDVDMGNREKIDLQQFRLVEDFQRHIQHWVHHADSLIEDSTEQQQAEKDHLIEFVVDYLEKNYADDISLEKLAEKRNMSSSYLSVYFKSKTGRNFSDYLNDLRIQAAKQLLAESEMTIQSIGEQVGYPSSNSFYRMFKKQTGLTPGEYRKRSK